MSKPDFASGLSKLKKPEPPAPEAKPESTAKGARAGKVAISAYFDPAVRQQLAIMAVRQDKTQANLLAEALNLLFEHYGESPIAKA